jgi:hypothetical protein
VPDKCRNCYDLEYKIKQLEEAASERRVTMVQLEQTHREALGAMARTLEEMNRHNAGLVAQIAQRDHLHAACQEVLAYGSTHARLQAAVADYERIKDTDIYPVEAVAVR